MPYSSSAVQGGTGWNQATLSKRKQRCLKPYHVVLWYGSQQELYTANTMNSTPCADPCLTTLIKPIEKLLHSSGQGGRARVVPTSCAAAPGANATGLRGRHGP